MKKRRIRNNDAKSTAAVEGAGWKILRPPASLRFVARKSVSEDDDSVTHRYESAYTIEDLAKQVMRREREEAR